MFPLPVSTFFTHQPCEYLQSSSSSPSFHTHHTNKQLTQPWRTLCGFPPTADTVTLRIPNGAWRPDTVITDYDGNEMFVLLDQTNEMRSYEAVFGDLDGRRLVCIKRHLTPQFWKDGYYFCTYQPNYVNQAALTDRDADNKRVYPFSYVQITAMKGRFFYRLFNDDQTTGPPRMMAENPWLGFMSVCCTPSVRLGKWTAKFQKSLSRKTALTIDQWRNVVDVGPGNDLLAALCLAYIFDRYQCQPLITVFGRDPAEEYEQQDDSSIESDKINNDDNEDENGANDGYRDSSERTGGGDGGDHRYEEEDEHGETDSLFANNDAGGHYRDDQDDGHRSIHDQSYHDNQSRASANRHDIPAEDDPFVPTSSSPSTGPNEIV